MCSFSHKSKCIKGAMWDMQPLFFPEMEGENTTQKRTVHTPTRYAQVILRVCWQL